MMKDYESHDAISEKNVNNISNPFSIKKISNQKWSLDLLSITLHPSFGGIVNQFLGRHENIHFVSFSWDAKKNSFKNNFTLNFIGNAVPLELYPGQSHEFSEIGLSLFPDAKVRESLNVGFIVFKSKKANQHLFAQMESLEAKINSSILLQELADVPTQLSPQNMAYFGYLEKKLIEEIEESLIEMNTKHVTTFKFQFPVDQEIEFYGSECYFQDGIRICLKKSKN